MARCIFCKNCPREWESIDCTPHECYNKIGKCKYLKKLHLELDQCIFEDTKCTAFDKRPQHEIDDITRVLKLIGIDVDD